jgi:TonB-linked SusC/RagA family outer membrane protein
MKRLLNVVLIVLGFSSLAVAQRTITGIVTDAAGEPLIGANVIAKEVPTLGTATDIDGSFSLQISANVATLLVSYTGYVSVEVPVTTANNYNIVLSEGNILQEVVVTTFGSTTRERFTGSAASISADKIGIRPITNVGQVLIGAAAGIQSTFGSGQPGSTPTIRIRGFGSVSSSNDPLYVVDGVPYTAAIANLQPDDIENVTILKDAASTSLYGSRAANGVVMITTKKGVKGKSAINVKYTRGYSERSVPEYDRIGPADYYPLMWEAYRNNLMTRASNPLTPEAASIQASKDIVGLVAYNVYNVPGADLVRTDGTLNPSAQLLYKPEDLDWEKPLIREGARNEVNLNYSGANDNNNYFASFSYTDDKGFLIRSDFERYTARLNFNAQLSSWLKAGTNLNFTHSESEIADAGGNTSFVNPFFFSRGMGPIYPVYAYDPANPGSFLLVDGKKIYDYGNLSALGLPNRPQYGGRHAIAETELNTNDFKRNVVGARAYADVSFLKDFKFTVNLGVDYTNRFDNVYGNPFIGDAAPAGRAFATYTNNFAVNVGQLLNYVKQFGKHGVNILIGHESFKYNTNVLDGGRSQLVVEGNPNLVNYTTTTSLTSYTDNRSIEGYFSRLNYDYEEKYFLSLSARSDGSSRFYKDSRWGLFYSAGVSWLLSREPFIKDISWIDNIKLRASYGETGNEDINTYYAWQILYGLGWNNAGEGGILQSRTVGNDKLKWETNASYDVGFEFGIFNNRISGTFDYFNRQSSNLLFEVPLPLSTGLLSQWQNIGTMYNRGVELELNIEPVRTKGFTWVISANIAKLTNKITKMPESNKEIISGTKKLSEGHGLYDYWLRQWRGVRPETGEALYVANVWNATNSFVNEKGDTLTTNINNARFGYNKSSIPDFSGGLANSFSFKGLTLSALMVYQIGGYVYDGAYATLMGSGGYGSSKHPDRLKRWQKAGDITNVPRMDAGRTTDFDGASDRWLTDGTSLSIRSVSLAYDLPVNFAKRMKLSAAQIILSGENLAIFTNRKGMNPQSAFSGVTSNEYSYSRTFAGGISITF